MSNTDDKKEKKIDLEKTKKPKKSAQRRSADPLASAMDPEGKQTVQKKPNVNIKDPSHMIGGITDLDAYIKSKTGAKAVLEKQDVQDHIETKKLESLGGVDLRTLPGIYAIVPNKKGSHKLVWMSDQAPEKLRADDKGREKGKPYMKKDLHIYDVKVDYKRHPTLKSTDGSRLDVWIIESEQELLDQIEAIKNGKGGGSNFEIPLIIGNLKAENRKAEDISNVDLGSPDITTTDLEATKIPTAVAEIKETQEEITLQDGNTDSTQELENEDIDENIEAADDIQESETNIETETDLDLDIDTSDLSINIDDINNNDLDIDLDLPEDDSEESENIDIQDKSSDKNTFHPDEASTLEDTTLDIDIGDLVIEEDTLDEVEDTQISDKSTDAITVRSDEATSLEKTSLTKEIIPSPEDLTIDIDDLTVEEPEEEIEETKIENNEILETSSEKDSTLSLVNNVDVDVEIEAEEPTPPLEENAINIDDISLEEETIELVETISPEVSQIPEKIAPMNEASNNSEGSISLDDLIDDEDEDLSDAVEKVEETVSEEIETYPADEPDTDEEESDIDEEIKDPVVAQDLASTTAPTSIHHDDDDEEVALPRIEANKEKVLLALKLLALLILLAAARGIYKLMFSSTTAPTDGEPVVIPDTQKSDILAPAPSPEPIPQPDPDPVLPSPEPDAPTDLPNIAPDTKNQAEPTKTDPTNDPQKQPENREIEEPEEISPAYRDDLIAKLEAQKRETRTLLNKARLINNSEALKYAVAGYTRAEETLTKVTANQDAFTAEQLQKTTERIDLYVKSVRDLLQ